MSVKKYASLLFFYAGDITSKVTEWDAVRVTQRFGGWENIPDDYYEKWRWADPFSWLYQKLMLISSDLDKNGDVWESATFDDFFDYLDDDLV
jgi:hypothetical protein